MNPHTTDPLRAIHTQVMWNRLIAVVEEQAQALLRTAFGSITREAGDLSAGVYDVGGRMLAQAVTGTPGHVNSMATAVAHFLDRYPATTMRAGDVFITNDPWLGTGHLFDYVVVTPVFRGMTIVGLFASTCHTLDVGGVGFSADARSVFEEGTRIPHLRLASAAGLNEDLLAIVCANSRNPIESRGDLLSLMSCNEVGARRLLDMMTEYRLESIDALAAHILEHSRTATRAAISRLPKGRWQASMRIDGYTEPVDLIASLEILDEKIVVDFAGSSPASSRGINSPKCYTDAYSVFGLKCVVAPEVPNNAGSLEPFEIRATPGSIVDPQPPAPVTARHVVGQMLPDLMFGCLEAAVDGRVPAESAGSIWVLPMSRGAGVRALHRSAGNTGDDSGGGAVDASASASAGHATPFNVMSVGLGGTGARAAKDGLSTTAFPSGVGAIPIEVTESQAPIVFHEKEFLIDSGGAGRRRGGLAQRIVIGARDRAPFSCAAGTFDRRDNPARGRNGGQDGAKGAVVIEDENRVGHAFAGKGEIRVPAGGRMVIELPGGGGFGAPRERARQDVLADIERGLVSETAAREVYGFDGGTR